MDWLARGFATIQPWEWIWYGTGLALGVIVIAVMSYLGRPRRRK